MIRMMPGVFQRVKQLPFRCATSCVEARGGDFEHSLHYSEGQNFETVLHILKTSLLYCLWY